MKSVSQIQPAKKLFQGERPPETDSQRRGSNPRPSAYEADALLLSHIGAPFAIHLGHNVPKRSQDLRHKHEKANGRDRTDDLPLTKRVLYR